MGFLDNTGLSRVWGKIKALVGTKQDTLVSGTNIKTVNNASLLGSGNVAVQEPLVGSGSGQNIKTINSTSILGAGNIAVQVPLVGSGEGQNIKTINNQSLLGSGNIDTTPTAITNAEIDDICV